MSSANRFLRLAGFGRRCAARRSIATKRPWTVLDTVEHAFSRYKPRVVQWVKETNIKVADGWRELAQASRYIRNIPKFAAVGGTMGFAYGLASSFIHQTEPIKRPIVYSIRGAAMGTIWPAYACAAAGCTASTVMLWLVANS